jgi:hypothetical protein
LEETEIDIKRLKHNQSPGIDLIKAELLKHAGQEFSRCVHKLLGQMWTSEIIPGEWSLSIICPIHNKDDVMVCPNCRGVNLLRTVYKS